MSAPVGSLRDLQELLDGRARDVFEQRPFSFYSVLLYTPTNGLNQRLHEYVASHFELFNAQTGPNWLVAVVEDINRKQPIETFKPQDVYEIARFLGARVDAIPAIVFFTEPKDRNETLVLRLTDILPEASEATDEKLTQFFGKLAATIDDTCRGGRPSSARLDALGQALRREWPKDPSWGARLSSAVEWLKTSAATATTVFGAISSVVALLRTAGLYSGR